MQPDFAYERSQLVLAGFREVTIRSFNDFIVGIRYFALGTDAIWQFTPSEGQRWNVTGFRGEDSLAVSYGYGRRSELPRVMGPMNPEWLYYAGYHTVDTPGRYTLASATSFEAFISVDFAGIRASEEAVVSFLVRHPPEPETRWELDKARLKAELEARESVLRNKEAFRKADEMLLSGARLAQTGSYALANEMYRQAGAMRERIQGYLDRREPVPAELVGQDAPLPSITPNALSASSLPDTYYVTQTGYPFYGQQYGNLSNNLGGLAGLSTGAVTFSSQAILGQPAQAPLRLAKQKPVTLTVPEIKPRVIRFSDD